MGNACMSSSSVAPVTKLGKEVVVEPTHNQPVAPVKENPNTKVSHNLKNKAFVSHGSKHRPVNFAAAAINDDTLAILSSLTNSKMAQIISKLYEPGESFSIQGFDDAKLKDLSEDYASLCEHALDKMCSAQDFTTRVKWQTCLLHLIQATYQSQFGDLSFFKVKKKADVLRAKYPIGSGEIDPNLKGLDGIEIPAGNKNAKLWDFLEFLKDAKYAQTRKDLEFITRNGKVATPSEIGAVSDICNYVQTLKTKFADDMKNTFKNSQEFKSNTKGLARAVFKMDEYAAKKERPSFNYIWDLLRCKAVYADIEDLRKDFVTLTSNYKVIQIKDKLKTALKNITINIVYDKVITEIQLVYGEVAGEYSNHKIYEVYRCESIQEAHKTILAWGDYNFESFKPLCGALLPTRNLEPQVCKGIRGRALHPVMKSKEYGVYTREPVCLSEDSENLACVYPVHLLYAHYDEKNIYAISLQGTPQILKGTEILSKTIKYNMFVQNATGVYDVKSGIKRLDLQMMTGETIVIGDKSAGSSPEEVSFDFQIPKHCVILGFGYQASEKSGIKSMYCWFGPIPDLDIDLEKYALTTEPSIGLPIKCHECTRQLMWCQSYPPEQTGSLPCRGCEKEIPPRAGFASCSKDFSSWCAACIIEQKKDLPVFPTPVKLRCPSQAHKVEWQWGHHNGPDFVCKGCTTTFESNCGRYTCPCGVYFCSNCEGDAKGAPNESEAVASFPVISADFPCGECNKPLQWYWHTNFFGYENQPFTCNACEKTYPASSGTFHCDKCEYDICSKCYCNSGKSDITAMPNFRNAKCPNGYYLTWQFSFPKTWTCGTCEEEFPEGTGCYACPKQEKKCCDFRECAGCYLLKFSNYEDYDEVEIPRASDERISYMTPYGKHYAGMDCYECGRDLMFLWHKNWAAEDEEGLLYVCDHHRGRVHCTAGVYYCLKCDYDLCTACYKKEKKTDLTVIPNISNKTCKKDVELVWSYDLPKEWTCTTCDNMYTDYQAGYACGCCGKAGYTCSYCVAKANEGETAKEEATCDNCSKQLKWYWNTHDIGEDYANENTSCNLCEREIPHNAGIYNCLSCEFDVCSGCQAHQKTKKFKINKFCEGKRPLVWAPGPDCEWQCNVCQETMPENLAAFKCGDLNCVCRGYTMCATCSRK